MDQLKWRIEKSESVPDIMGKKKATATANGWNTASDT